MAAESFTEQLATWSDTAAFINGLCLRNFPQADVMFQTGWHHKGYLCKVNSNSHDMSAGAKGMVTHNEPTLAALDWDNGHCGRPARSLCRENPIKALSSNDHVFQRGCWVSQRIDFHWKSVKLTVEGCTVSLQRDTLFLGPRHASPASRAECRMISVVIWGDAQQETASVWWLALRRSCLRSKLWLREASVSQPSSWGR